MDEIRIKKENVLNCFKEIELWREVTPVCLKEVFSQLFPETFEEEKKEPIEKTAKELLELWFAMTTKEEQEKAFADIKAKIPDNVKEPEESELENLIFERTTLCKSDCEILTDDIRALAIRKIEECKDVSITAPSNKVIIINEAKRKLEGM